MHKSSVRLRFSSVRQKKSEVRFGSGSAKSSWFGPRFSFNSSFHFNQNGVKRGERSKCGYLVLVQTPT